MFNRAGRIICFQKCLQPSLHSFVRLRWKNNFYSHSCFSGFVKQKCVNPKQVESCFAGNFQVSNSWCFLRANIIVMINVSNQDYTNFCWFSEKIMTNFSAVLLDSRNKNVWINLCYQNILGKECHQRVQEHTLEQLKSQRKLLILFLQFATFFRFENDVFISYLSSR